MRQLVRLFPAEWRLRYGDEFTALLEDVPPGLTIVVDVVKAAFRARAALLRRRLSPAGGPAMDLTDRLPGRRLAVAALVLVLPTVAFVAASLLKYSAGIPGPFDAIWPIAALPPVEAVIVVAPWLALALAVAPAVGLRVSRSDSRLVASVVLRLDRRLNLAVALAVTAVVAVLVLYYLAENVLR